MIESKKRAFIFLFLAFILALVAGYFVYEKVKSLNAELGGMTEVYVANDNIPARQEISEKAVTVMEIPNKFVTDSHITSMEDLKNRVSVVQLGEGDLITEEMIKPVSHLRDENNRLVSLPASETLTFDQFIEPLDRVDLVVSREMEGEKRTETFMKDVLVYHAQSKDNNMLGIGVVIPAERVEELIHVQHYAEHIRVLKANVGNSNASDGSNSG
ncbi:flp pilus assembly protein CpaB [Virgibacillus sp. MSP4-1]|uniref:Flp pilus assembly protein CpaB n=1 Tax=Virgibacillus sp. MSP4-1 TaxID=2700081 RepID=UPI0003AA45ED|nr:SAF domain-containing protein [Virgibacillus sp. MSP4-1]QHS24151.1 flp pilus assembly protein CpaB [Virgibacillus sp. MSP4-1]